MNDTERWFTTDKTDIWRQGNLIHSQSPIALLERVWQQWVNWLASPKHIQLCQGVERFDHLRIAPQITNVLSIVVWL